MSDTTMTAGREMDAEVAGQVFGWPVKWLPTALVPSAPHYLNSEEGSGWLYLRHCSTDVGAAMQVVAEVQRRHPGWRFSLLGGDTSFAMVRRAGGVEVDYRQRESFGWVAEFFGHEDPAQNAGQRHASEHAASAAHAICLAALAAARHPGGEG